MNLRNAGIGFLVLVFLPACVHPQTYPFQFYTTSDGLAQSNVSAIFQDSHGAIWFGTGGGITRYDGDKYWSVKNGSVRVLCICEDSVGRVWFGTTTGLCSLRYPDTMLTWVRAPADTLLPSGLVLALHTDRSGNVWAGTTAGLLCLRRDGGHVLLTKEHGLLHDDVHSIAEDSTGALLVGSGGGIQRVVMSDQAVPRFMTIVASPVGRFAMLRSGGLLYSNISRRSVIRWTRSGQDELYRADRPGSGTYPTAFVDDAEGNIWIGTTEGIVVLKERRATRITRREGLQNSFINTIFRDREGNLWFGTEGGVAKRPYEPANIYNSATGLPEDHVIAVFVDSKGNAWFGTYDGAACLRTDGGLRAFSTVDGLPHLSVHDFCEDIRGNVWIGTYGGLRLFSHGSVRLPQNPSLRSRRVIRLLRDDDGTIWCGGDRELLRISPDGTIRVVVDSLTITRSNVSALFHDTQGRLWFGTDDEGAGCLENGSVRMYDYSAGLPDLWVMSIVEDRHQHIWFTTQKGAVVWNGVRFEPIPTQEDPLRHDAVPFAVRDSSGHLWFGTQHGVYEWDDSLLGHWDNQNGLAAEAARRGYVDRTGQVWVGTVGGVSKLNPRAVLTRNGPPPAYLKGIELDSRPGSLVSSTDLGYTDNTLVFHFNAVSFIDEQRTEFRWMLAGFDQTWQPPATGRSVRYTHLPPGTYEFLVSARNRGTGWSTPARFAFSIHPPFWETWWFGPATSILLLGLLFWLIRRRIAHLDREQRLQRQFSLELMNSQESERKRIASELHDSLGQDLLVIRNRALLGLKDAPADASSRAQLEQISTIATEAINDVREISHNLRPYQIDRLGLTKALRSLADSVADSTSLRMSIQIDAVDDALAGEDAIHLYRMVQEGVNNILKHAEAQCAELQIRRETGHIRIIVRDDGKGFTRETPSEQSLPRGLGLIGISERARALNGSLAVESSPGKGTTLSILIPCTP